MEEILALVGKILDSGQRDNLIKALRDLEEGYLLTPHEIKILRCGFIEDKINAIKLVKSRLHIGLNEAKVHVERYMVQIGLGRFTGPLKSSP